MNGEHPNTREAPTTDRQVSHTPGPWLLYRDNRRERYGIGVKGEFALRLVAEVSFGFSEPAESEQHANARLIAAAPELLAALKRLLATQYPGTENHHETGCRCFIHEAQVAIAKAEGRPNAG